MDLGKKRHAKMKKLHDINWLTRSDHQKIGNDTTPIPEPSAARSAPAGVGTRKIGEMLTGFSTKPVIGRPMQKRTDIATAPPTARDSRWMQAPVSRPSVEEKKSALRSATAIRIKSMPDTPPMKNEIDTTGSVADNAEHRWISKHINDQAT